MESLEKNLSITKWFPDVDKDLLLLAISTPQRSYLSTGAERRLREKYAAIRFDYETLEFFGDKVLGMLAISQMIKIFDLGRSIKDYAYYFKEFVRNRNLTKISLNLGLCEDIFPEEDVTIKHNACADVIESILGALFVQYQSMEIIEKWFFSVPEIRDNIDNIFEIEYPPSEGSGDSGSEESSREEIIPEEIPEEVVPPIIEIKQKKVKKATVNFVPIPTNNSEENIKIFEELIDHDIRKWKIKIPESMIQVSTSFFLTPEEIFPLLARVSNSIEVPPIIIKDNKNSFEQMQYLNNYSLKPSERLRGKYHVGKLDIYSSFYSIDFYGYYYGNKGILTKNQFQSQIGISMDQKDFEKYVEFYSLLSANIKYFGGVVDFSTKFEISSVRIPRPVNFKYSLAVTAVNLTTTGKYLPSSIIYDINTRIYLQRDGQTEKIGGISNHINEKRPITFEDSIDCVKKIFQIIKTKEITPFYDVPKFYQKLFGIEGKAYGLRMIIDGKIEERLLSFVSMPDLTEDVISKGVLAFQCLRMLTLVTNLQFPEIDNVEILLDPKFYYADYFHYPKK